MGLGAPPTIFLQSTLEKHSEHSTNNQQHTHTVCGCWQVCVFDRQRTNKRKNWKFVNLFVVHFCLFRLRFQQLFDKPTLFLALILSSLALQHCFATIFIEKSVLLIFVQLKIWTTVFYIVVFLWHIFFDNIYFLCAHKQKQEPRSFLAGKASKKHSTYMLSKAEKFLARNIHFSIF